MNYCVYIHTNKINGKKYVGQTCQKVSCRWRNGSGYRANIYFFRSINSYGWDNFSHEIIADGLSLEEANKLETELIQKHNSLYPNGYNILSGGDNRTIPDSVKEKIRNAHIGKTHLCSEETKQKISNANKGRVMSAESRENMSKGQTGKKYSEETKKKRSEQLKREWANGVRKPNGIPSPNRKPITATNIKTGETFNFEYITQASEILNVKRTDISSCLSGRQQSAHGYIFYEVRV